MPSSWTIGQLEVTFIVLAPFVGSFLGLLVDRVPQGESIVAPRSHCRACAKTLGWSELVPIWSWLVQAGRCRCRRVAIPGAFLAIEVLSLLSVVISALVFDGAQFVAACLLSWVLIGLGFADWKHLLLPDSLVLALFAAGLGYSVYWSYPDLSGALPALVGAAAGGLSFWAIRGGYHLMTGREGLGLGDVKFMAGAGAWVFWHGLAHVALVASLLALTVVVVASLATGTRLDRHHRLPFGSFLCVATWLVWAHGGAPTALSVLSALAG